MICWGVTDGSAGTMAQVKALAEALRYTPVMKRIAIKPPFIWLPNALYGGSLRKWLPGAMTSYDIIGEPWPDVIISCGRRGALAALGLKMRMHGKPVKLIHIHDPQMAAKHFDLIVAMQHDERINAPNVIKTSFALHNITPELMASSQEKFAKRFTGYSAPYVAVLLGGSTNKYKLKKKHMAKVIERLQTLHNATTGSLLITVSRRTGHKNLQALLKVFPRIRESRSYIYDGIGDNPYLGMLALAEYIVVTNDSVNMMSEAIATGKPVHILRLPGHKNTKPARFAEKLIADGIARPFEGKLESWTYQAEQEMKALADSIRERLQLPAPAEPARSSRKVLAATA